MGTPNHRFSPILENLHICLVPLELMDFTEHHLPLHRWPPEYIVVLGCVHPSNCRSIYLHKVNVNKTHLTSGWWFQLLVILDHQG
jgi:hypothetical protein